MIVDVFEKAYKSDRSVIILDGIGSLIEYTSMGPRFSNQLLQTIMVLIGKVPPIGKKLIVIGTLTDIGDLSEEFHDLFDAVEKLGAGA